jgi:hypothetical protein
VKEENIAAEEEGMYPFSADNNNRITPFFKFQADE